MINSNINLSGKIDDVTGNGRETVLIVDDDYVLQSLGRDILLLQGYEVLTAGSGLEAVRIIKSHPRRVKLVILNIAMSGMGGLETTKTLRTCDPAIKTIISSSFHPSRKVIDQLGSYVDAFLNKPYEVDRMITEVRRLLNDWVEAVV